MKDAVAWLEERAAQVRQSAQEYLHQEELRAEHLEALARDIGKALADGDVGPLLMRQPSPVPASVGHSIFPGMDKAVALEVYLKQRPEVDWIGVEELVAGLVAPGADLGLEEFRQKNIINTAIQGKRMFLYDKVGRRVKLAPTAYESPKLRGPRRRGANA